MEWGRAALNSEAELFIIVDVMSFSTCVSVALEQGAEILPYYYKDQRVQEFAEQHGAQWVGPRAHDRPSLSPASLRRLQPGERWVLPSPNGASLSFEAQQQHPHSEVWASCLRNAQATARQILASGAQRIQLVAAGERWPDGSLRPAIEDALGVGAVVQYLRGMAQTDLKLSAEARWAGLGFEACQGQIQTLLEDSLSGQELIQRGFPEDLSLASELSTSQTVAVLKQGAYVQRPQRS